MSGGFEVPGAAPRPNRSMPPRTAAAASSAAHAAVDGNSKAPADDDGLSRYPDARRANGAHANPFDIPRERMNPNLDYEWKVLTVLGDPALADSPQAIRDGGWVAERASDWPSLAEPTAGPNDPVIRGGQALYARRKQLTMQARAEDDRRAHQQRRDRQAALVEGAADIAGIPGVSNAKAFEFDVDLVGPVDGRMPRFETGRGG